MKTASADAARVTELLRAWAAGSEQAGERLMPLVYQELRRRAAAQLRRERRGHSLQPTALVHEAYLRLMGQRAGWADRSHFFAVASKMMRRILVDHARARQRLKRAGGVRVTLAEGLARASPREVDLVLLDEALEELAAIDPRQSHLVELRYFGGLTEEEAAATLGVSRATATREWRMARAWLHRRLTRGSSGKAIT